MGKTCISHDGNEKCIKKTVAGKHEEERLMIGSCREHM
jgi:hypothetical protein